LPAGSIGSIKDKAAWMEIKFMLLFLAQLSRLLEHAVIVSQPLSPGNEKKIISMPSLAAV